MWEYNCKGRVLCIKVRDGLIAAGCEDGWIYLFDVDGVLWGKKLTATYYRGPYTDVNVVSIDVDKKRLAAGTDFADGKIYVYSTKGDLEWKRQFMCIVGCWERPEDVVGVSLGKDRIAVCSEWLNSYLHVYDFNGEPILDMEVSGSVRDVEAREKVAVATSEALYLDKRKFEIPSSRVFLHDKVFVAGKDGVYAIDGDVEWKYEAANPLVAVSDENIAVCSDKLSVLSRDGEVVWETSVDKPETLFIFEDGVYAGYVGKVAVYKEGEAVRLIHVEGLPVHVGDFILCIDGRRVILYDEV